MAELVRPLVFSISTRSSLADGYSQFLTAGTDIPGVGKVELSWTNTPFAAGPLAQQQKNTDESNTAMAGTGTGHGAAAGAGATDGGKADVEYDVAEDDDRWMNVS